jgi:hypothetical protein
MPYDVNSRTLTGETELCANNKAPATNTKRITTVFVNPKNSFHKKNPDFSSDEKEALIFSPAV